MLKTYYLIHIIFGNNGVNSFAIYPYVKTRRMTANQAWAYINKNPEKEVYASGLLSQHANINDYYKIIDTHNLNLKLCDDYVSFGFIKN